MQIDFASSRQSTLGVEWEVALVDRHTSDLRSVAEEVLAELNLRHGLLAIDEEHPHVKQELLLNTVEIVTGVCETVAEAKTQLHENLVAVREVTDPMDVDLYCAGSHPFAPPSCGQTPTRTATPR